MDTRITIITIALVGIFLVCAGCTQNAQPQVTQVATPSPTSAPPTSVPTILEVTPVPPTKAPDYIEGPLPPQYTVTVDVDRNTVATNPLITVSYRGGKGINFVSSMDVEVTRSDGKVLTESKLKPMVNDKIEIIGTQGTDNVRIYIRLVNGERYLVIDQDMPFRSFY